MDETILQKIPHRPPFLFVDKVLERSGEGITTAYAWKADSDFYKGHYPQYPLTPGVLLCESVFQTAGVFLSDRIAQGSSLMPVLTRIHSARFKNVVRPGDLTTIEVKLVESHDGRFFTLRGFVRGDNKLSLTIDFTVAMVEEIGD